MTEPRGPATEPLRRTEIVVPIRTIIVLAAALFAGWALSSIRDALLIIFMGIFLGVVFEYPVRWVERRLKTSRGVSATITVLGAAAGLTLLGLLLLVPMVEGVRDFLRGLPDIVQDLRDSGVFSSVGDSAAAEDVQGGASEIAKAIPTGVSAVLGIAGQVFSVALVLFTVTFTALFFLNDVARMRESVGSVLTPVQERRWLTIWDRATVSISRWAIGVLIIAAIAGTVQGVTAWLLGSSFALALGLIAGVLDTIPNIGATIGGFILGLTLLAEEGVTAALIMAAVVLVYQQVENNLLTPTIQGKATSISGFFVIVGVTVFGALLGVVGAIIAVPITATIQIIVQEISATRRREMAELRAAGAVRHESPY